MKNLNFDLIFTIIVTDQNSLFELTFSLQLLLMLLFEIFYHLDFEKVWIVGSTQFISFLLKNHGFNLIGSHNLDFRRGSGLTTIVHELADFGEFQAILLLDYFDLSVIVDFILIFLSLYLNSLYHDTRFSLLKKARLWYNDPESLLVELIYI